MTVSLISLSPEETAPVSRRAKTGPCLFWVLGFSLCCESGVCLLFVSGVDLRDVFLITECSYEQGSHYDSQSLSPLVFNPSSVITGYISTSCLFLQILELNSDQIQVKGNTLLVVHLINPLNVFFYYPCYNKFTQ